MGRTVTRRRCCACCWTTVLHIRVYSSTRSHSTTRTHGDVLLAHVHERVHHAVYCLTLRQRHRRQRVQNCETRVQQVVADRLLVLLLTPHTRPYLDRSPRDHTTVVALRTSLFVTPFTQYSQQEASTPHPSEVPPYTSPRESSPCPTDPRSPCTCTRQR